VGAPACFAGHAGRGDDSGIAGQLVAHTHLWGIRANGFPYGQADVTGLGIGYFGSRIRQSVGDGLTSGANRGSS
jgi:hypothetical protein